MFSGLFVSLILLGILCAKNLIISRLPSAKDLIAKLAPYEGWIGAVSALWGLWGVIWLILNISLLTSFPIRWPLALADCLVIIGMGLLLGVGVLKTFLKQPTVQAKLDQTVTKLAPYQGILGIVGLVLGIVSFIV